jgi:hypothetical protein
VSSLFQDVKISEATLNKAFEHQAVLSINQLEKIADYFNHRLTQRLKIIVDLNIYEIYNTL